jgi:hypothetical protein
VKQDAVFHPLDKNGRKVEGKLAPPQKFRKEIKNAGPNGVIEKTLIKSNPEKKLRRDFKGCAVKSTITVYENIDLINQNLGSSLIESNFCKISWAEVCSGLKLLNADNHVDILQKYDKTYLSKLKQSLVLNQENIIERSLSHKQFIEYVTNARN